MRTHLVLTRRSVVGATGLAGITLASAARGEASDVDDALVERLAGRAVTPSARVRLVMPAAFSNGYTVPLTLEVESPMTYADHVRQVRVFAPKNPIVLVAAFQFTPLSGRARVSTRVRLAEPQSVIAVAEFADGTALMARTWVKVDVNGCA